MTKAIAMFRSGLDLLGVVGTPPRYQSLSNTPFSNDRKTIAKDASVIARCYRDSARKVFDESKKIRRTGY